MTARPCRSHPLSLPSQLLHTPLARETRDGCEGLSSVRQMRAVIHNPQPLALARAVPPPPPDLLAEHRAFVCDLACPSHPQQIHAAQKPRPRPHFATHNTTFMTAQSATFSHRAPPPLTRVLAQRPRRVDPRLSSPRPCPHPSGLLSHLEAAHAAHLVHARTRYSPRAKKVRISCALSPW
jgi:hypothetical protein